jgi:hypothetical protein
MAWYEINSSLKYNTITIDQWFAACENSADFKIAPGATKGFFVLLYIIYW